MPDNKPTLPASQKEAPKVTSTGTQKSPTTGSTQTASSAIGTKSDAEKSGVVTGDKTSSQTPREKELANAEGSKESNEPLEANFSKIEGEVLQGDSFRITLVRGNKTIRIPVPLESSRDVVTMSNTFRLIKEIGEAKSAKELDEKFHAFIAP